MKNKIHKVVGIALTFVLVASMMVFALPVAVSANPGTNLWEPQAIPRDGTLGGWLIADDAGAAQVGPIAKAIDGTLYSRATPSVAATTSLLFKSTDGGNSWVDTGFVAVNLTDIVCSRTDANVLFITDATNVWKSINAGATFNMLGAVVGGNISSIDCVELSAGKYLIVAGVTAAGTEDVYTYDESATFPTWTSQGFNAYCTATAAYGATEDNLSDVWAAFSPNFNTDHQIVAVALGDFDDDDALDDTIVSTKMLGAGWGATVGDVGIANLTIIRADIAFPSDYNSDILAGNHTYFIGLSDGFVGGDVYQILGVAAPGASVAVDRNVVAAANRDIWSIDVAGTTAAALILAGGDSTGVIYYSATGGASWEIIYKQPSGPGDVYVVMADDFATSTEAWAAVWGDEGAVSHTAGLGCIAWDNWGLIDTTMTALNDLSITGDTIFLTSEDATGDDSVWKFDGTYWARVWNSADASDMVEVSPDYATDNTVFIANRGGTTIMYSPNGGGFFAPATSPITVGTIQSWLIRDANTIILGSTATNGVNITANKGLSWTNRAIATAGAILSIVDSPDFANDSTMLCGDDTGEVYRSTMAGALWAQIGVSLDAAEDAHVAFSPDYATDSTIYHTLTDLAANGPGGVYRFVIGVDAAWGQIDDLAGLPAAPRDVDYGTGIAISADGTLYAADSVVGEGMSRCLNPTGSAVTAALFPYFEEIDDTTAGAITVILSKLWLTPGSNVLYALGGPIAAPTSLWRYEDVLAVSVTGGTASVATGAASLSWDALPGALQYDVVVNTQPNLQGFAQTMLSTGAALGNPVLPQDIAGTPAAPLAAGTTYYWVARVSAQSPCQSRFSAVNEFSTAYATMTISADSFGPAIGASGVPIKPGFGWAPVAGATGYEFELATKAGTGAGGYFIDALLTKTGTNVLPNSVFECEIDLDYNTTYFWHVKAVGAAAESGWATGVFTTMAKPAPPVIVEPTPPAPPAPAPTPPPVIEIPPAPAPQMITPAWIWAIVIIGAVLVIAVIVLIVTTRRVP